MAEARNPAWQATDPLAALAAATKGAAGSAAEPGVRISTLSPAQMTALIPRRDVQAEAATHLLDTLGLALPAPRSLTRHERDVLLWTGLDQFLLVADAPFEPDRLDPDLIAVTDQTGARVLVNVTGPHARDALAKGCLIDLHPRSFAPDAVTMTTVAHLGVLIWRAGDGFTLASPRSTAADLWHWLTISSAEFGLAID
jgi:methylglutamate dehydrogenase subunit D